MKNVSLRYGLNGTYNAIQLQKNNDAVNISIFTSEPFDFAKEEFIRFLQKHYESYLRLIDM